MEGGPLSRRSKQNLKLNSEYRENPFLRVGS
jgi:hypothetical protein